jgi:exodeoxyribonuclease VII small subunit
MTVNDTNTLSFDDALGQLELLVRTLEEGRLPLEDAINAFEKGSKLRKLCEEKLVSAKLKVDQIVRDQDGTVHLEPYTTAQAS